MLSPKTISKLRRELKTGKSRYSLLFRALAEPNRLRLFQLLAHQPGICVTELAAILKLTVPAVSQHLKILEMSGLIRKERRGQLSCYQIQRNKPLTQTLIRLLR